MSVSVNSTNKHKGDMMERRVIHRETKVATLGQMRAAAEALKGVDRACDITQAKPEFVEFIRKCSPASVLAVLNQHATLTAEFSLQRLPDHGIVRRVKIRSNEHIAQEYGLQEDGAEENQMRRVQGGNRHWS